MWMFEKMKTLEENIKSWKKIIFKKLKKKLCVDTDKKKLKMLVEKIINKKLYLNLGHPRMWIVRYITNICIYIYTLLILIQRMQLRSSLFDIYFRFILLGNLMYNK